MTKTDLTLFSLFQTNFNLFSPQTVYPAVLPLSVTSCVKELLQIDGRKKRGNRKKSERERWWDQGRTERIEEKRDKGAGTKRRREKDEVRQSCAH